MKKITLLILSLGLCFAGWSQTLNQNASWPNTNWSVTGTFNTDPLAFESDPTLTANFAFDDDDAGGASDDNIAAESPMIDLTAAFTAGENWITVSTMYVHRYLANDELVIQYWDADGATWVAWGNPYTTSTAGAPTNDYCSAVSVPLTTDVLNIAGFSPTQLSGFRYRIAYDDNPAGSDWNYGFCFQSPTITSATPPSCPDPSVLTVSTITDTTADLAWTENGSATAWDVEIVTTGIAPSGTPTSTGVSNPYTAIMLAADTEYDYYLRSNCGVDGTSAWIGPLTFRTACAPVAAPYTEDFELFTTSTFAFASGNCWAGTGGAYFWESAPGTDTGSGSTGPDPSITTGNYFYTEASGGTAGSTTDLVSPLVDLTALTAPSLSFNYHMFGGQIGTLDVLVNGTTNVWTLSGQQQTSATAPWELAVVDLTAYAGQTISITFRATSAGTFEGDLAIDNVVFDEAPSCFAPTNVLVTATSIDGATIDFTNANTSTNTNVEYGAPGFVQGAGTPLAYTTLPFSLTGLMSATTYDFYLQSDCGMGDLTAWVGPFSFTTDCVAVADFNENFDGVATPDLPNCWSSFSTVLGSGTQPYVQTSTLADETAPNGVRLYSGSSTGNIGSGTTIEGETILISPQLNNLSAGTHRVRFFADAGTATSTLELGTITDPTDPSTFTSLTALAPTTTHSEFIVNFDSYAGTDQYIAFRHIFVSTFDSMYLDNIVWEVIPSCSDTSNLTLANNTDVTATINFDSGNATSAGNYEYSLATVAGTAPAVSGSWSDIAGANPNVTYTIIGLTAATEYFVHVREVCAVGVESVWSSVPVNFTTACATIVPDALETFDTFVPDCWEEAADGDLTTGPTGFGSGDWGAEEFAHSSTSGGGAVNINLYRNVASDWIVSPLYDLSAGGYELNIDVAVTNYNSTGADNMGSDDLVVLAYTTDGTTWTALQTWDVNNQPATAGETYNDALTGINSATVRFGIYATDGAIDDAGVDYDFHIDNFQIRTPPACPDTSNLTLASNTDVTATVNFDSGNAMSAGNYEYSLTTVAGATPVISGAWSDVAGATPNVTYTITGLTAETEYFVHVREVCAVGDESAWSLTPLNFTTSCAVVSSFPYTTDFTNNVPNACWDEAGSGEIVDGPMTVGSSDWRSNRSYEDFSGTVIPSNAMNLFSGNSDREWLLSEQYDMTGTSNDVLSIEVAVTDWTSSGASDATDTATMGSDDQVDLLITTDAGMTWTSLMTWTAANQPAVDGTRAFIDLSSYTGTVQLAFFASDGTVDDSEDYDFHVGMFIIDGTAGNEDVFESTLSLYPNPVNGDVVTISMDQRGASSIEVVVFNTLGQQVMTRSFDQVNHTINIDNISSLSKGMYFVKISSGTQQATLKFIKE